MGTSGHSIWASPATNNHPMQLHKRAIKSNIQRVSAQVQYGGWQIVFLDTCALASIGSMHSFTKAWLSNWRCYQSGHFYYFWTFYMWVHTLPFIGTKPSHACVFLLPYRRRFCLLWLKPQKWYRPTTALTPPAGRDAPSHLLCLRVFATQTEHSSPILKDCNASSVLVIMNSLPKLNKAFYSISHLHSAIGKFFVREHCITFENEPFSKFREEVGDNHVNSHLPIPTPVPYI